MTEPTPAQGQPVTPAEETAPYGAGPSGETATPAGPTAETTRTDPTTDPSIRRVRTHHLARWKEEGLPWAMLTAYDQYTAGVFDEAGIPVLLVGDSASNNVFGHASSLPVTVEEMLSLVKAVTRSARRALVVADLPFGSYQRSPEQAYDTAVRFLKEGEAHMVKLEGGTAMCPQIELLTRGAIPVMAHLGFTPQAEHSLGGYRVQGRGDQAAKQLLEDAIAVQEAGASAVVLEMVPAPVAAEVTRTLHIPTVGIGAGIQCDAQVLVWQDMMGLRTGAGPRFVKRYADLHGVMLNAAREYAADVASGAFPGPEHGFDS